MTTYIKIFRWYGWRCKGKDSETAEKTDVCKRATALPIPLATTFNHKDLNGVAAVKAIAMSTALPEHPKLWLYICKYTLIMGFFLFIVNHSLGENVNTSVAKYVLREILIIKCSPHFICFCMSAIPWYGMEINYASSTVIIHSLIIFCVLNMALNFVTIRIR